MSLFLKDFPPICPYFLGFRVGKYGVIQNYLSLHIILPYISAAESQKGIITTGTMMFCWESEGHCCHRHWAALMPLWLSTDDSVFNFDNFFDKFIYKNSYNFFFYRKSLKYHKVCLLYTFYTRHLVLSNFKSTCDMNVKPCPCNIWAVSLQSVSLLCIQGHCHVFMSCPIFPQGKPSSFIFGTFPPSCNWLLPLYLQSYCQ